MSNDDQNTNPDAREQAAIDFASKLDIPEGFAATVKAPLHTPEQEEGMYRVLYCWAPTPSQMNDNIALALSAGSALRDKQLDRGQPDAPLQCTVIRNEAGFPIAVVASLDPMTYEEAVRAVKLDIEGTEAWD